ncbi:MAG: glutamate synthase small subunit, partial [Epsilonproteobacteria bacterium]
ASSVKCLYRRDELNMPGSKKEVQNAKEEGVEFVFNVSPKSIKTNAGILATSLELDKTQLSKPDNNGRQKVEIIKNSTYLEEVDVIILALGFDQELPQFIKDINLDLDKWNGIKVDENHQTSNSKIYAGGDGVRGADLAVRAAADGKAAAKAMVERFTK